MPVRRRIEAVQERRIHPFAFKVSDGTRNFTGQDVFPDRESAGRAWPDYRREVWATTFRGSLPCAAEIFDGLTTNGAQFVHDHWQHEVFDLDGAVAAIAVDRENVRRFEQQNPRGFRDIRDYLAIFCQYFDRAEREARRLATSTAEYPWSRGYPQILSGGRYGDNV